MTVNYISPNTSISFFTALPRYMNSWGCVLDVALSLRWAQSKLCLYHQALNVGEITDGAVYQVKEVICTEIYGGEAFKGDWLSGGVVKLFRVFCLFFVLFCTALPLIVSAYLGGYMSYMRAVLSGCFAIGFLFSVKALERSCWVLPDRDTGNDIGKLAPLDGSALEQAVKLRPTVKYVQFKEVHVRIEKLEGKG